MSKKPTVLMILDGYGLNDRTDGNAVAQAKTPVMDQLMKEYPFVKGNASGLAVGLPDGQMGNSEVGHMNMGAGSNVWILASKPVITLLLGAAVPHFPRLWFLPAGYSSGTRSRFYGCGVRHAGTCSWSS